MDCTEQDQVKF